MRGRNFSNFFYVGHKYKEEVRTQIRMFLIFTFAFTIAFTWRETIFDLSKNFMQRVTGAEGTGSISTLASLFITAVFVLLIFITSHYFKKNE